MNKKKFRVGWLLAFVAVVMAAITLGVCLTAPTVNAAYVDGN